MTIRALNAAVHCKHVWTRGQHAAEVFEVLMLLMLLAFILVLEYQAQLEEEPLWNRWRLRRVTVRYLAECWLLTLAEAAGLFAPAG